jgi:hypothetical protein
MTERLIVPNGYCAGPQPVLLTVAGSSFPLLEIQTSATDFLRILAITCFLADGLNTSNPNSFGFGTPAAAGVGIGGTRLMIAEDTGDTSISPSMSLFTAWSKPPTAPTNFVRRAILTTNFATNAFLGLTFRFARGFFLPPNSSAVVWTASGGGQGNIFDVELICDA